MNVSLPNALDLKPPAYDLKGFGKARAARLGDVGAERTRRRKDALRLYEPMVEQEAFHQSLATERLLRGGNRGGKSVAGYIEDARCALGLDPHNKFPIDRPLRIWLICYNEGQIGRTAYRLLFCRGAFDIIRDLKTGEWRSYQPWDPEDVAREQEVKPAPPLIPPRFAPPESFAWKDKGRRIFNVCRLKFPPGHPMDGTEIHAFPSGGEPPSGDPVDLIHIDEDLVYARHVAEYQSRLSDTKGRLIWTARPHMRNDALIRMSVRAEEQADRAQPDVEEFRLTYSSNPFIDSDEKRKRLEGWSEEERRARDAGEFLFDTVLMYPSFHMDVHGIPAKHGRTKLDEMLADRQVPPNATRYMVVDPGHTVCAVLFAFVPPPGYGDVVVAYDELYLKQCDAAKFARAVEPKVAGHQFHAFIIDDHGSRVTQLGSGLTVRQQYSDELRARRIASRITGHGFLKGSDDVPARSAEVRRWLARRPDGTTRFRFFRDTMPNLVSEFRNYRKRIGVDETQDKPVPGKDHLCDCFDAQTEVLSSDGWRRFAELSEGATLATVNLKTDCIEYQAPTARIARQYVGEMMHFGGRKLNGLVTPNHRMVVYTARARNGGGAPSIRRAGDVVPGNSIKLHAAWKGTQRDIVLVPRICNAMGLEKELPPELFAEFLGWYIAEGCCATRPQCPGSGYRIHIAQKHVQKRAIVSALLSQLPWKWWSDSSGFSCSSKQLWSYLSPLGNCYGKRVPEWIKDAEPEVIRRFLMGAIMGDGTIQNGAHKYYTVSPLLADDVQELFIKLGVTASVRSKKQNDYHIRGRTGRCSSLYVVCEWTGSHGHLRNAKGQPNYSPIEYDGMVYCATVPNGTLIVRRHGKPMVAGNCAAYLAAYNPQYHAPPRLEPQSAAMLHEFQQWQKKADDQPSGEDRFLYGSDGSGIYLGPGAATAV